jgi:tetratricopeptide (TPR) repeat protein
MSRYYELTRSAVERHGGTVEKFIGDAVMAVFGVPITHEDDALRAVRAAADMRDAIARYNRELESAYGTTIRLRIGINTGEVVVGDAAAESSFISGDAVNVAARLEQSAMPGEILISARTLPLVRSVVTTEPIEPLELKGKAQPVAAHRLIEMSRDLPAFARHMDSPFVGREQELAALQHVVARVLDERRCRLVTVLGPPGAGKSRITAELARDVSGQVRVLNGRCLPYGEGITFWPIAEVAKQVASIGEDESQSAVRAKLIHLLGTDSDAPLVAERVAGVLGFGTPAFDQQELFWGLRSLFERLAVRSPVLLVFDDIQWAEESFLDLLDYLVDFVVSHPIALVCLARPELLEKRPDWAAGRPNALAITLNPLAASESRGLIANLLDGPLEPTVQARIVERAGGNPLFIQESIRMLIDQGELRRSNGAWELTTEVSDLVIPPTVNAILAARLDRLPDEERDVLERAAVAGEVFWWRSVEELSDEVLRPRVGSNLRSLVRRELIRPHESTLIGEDAYAFSHLLVRDAAYGLLPKRLRAELHERLATWIETTARQRMSEYEEIIGYHLEQACRFGAEIHLNEAHRQELAASAATHLGRAGHRALWRVDPRAATNLLRRAAALQGASAPERSRLLVALGKALGLTGHLDEARMVLQEAVDLAEAASDPVTRAHGVLELLDLKMNVDPEGAADEAAATVEPILVTLADAGDDAGLARAWNVMGAVHVMRGNDGPLEEAAERAIIHARRARDPVQEAGGLLNLAIALIFGPRPAPDMEARSTELLADAQGNRAGTAAILAARGMARALMGRFDEGRRDARSSSALLEEIGMDVDRAAYTMVTAGIERLAGDLAAAEAQLRVACRVLEDAGAAAVLSTTAATCARVILEREGEEIEITRFLDLAEGAGSSDDFATQLFVRSTRARLLARARKFDEALELARSAVDLASPGDTFLEHAESLLALGEVEAAVGLTTEARAHWEEAIALFEAKGDVVTPARVRALLESSVRD